MVVGVKRYVVAGGSGFIGTELCRALVERGDEVTVLTRNANAARRRSRLPSEVELVEWDPERDGEWQGVLDGKDGVVHLAGEVLVGRRYTEELKQEFYASRVTSTERIVTGIELASERPKVFVCGSAIGYYGVDRGLEVLDERSEPGDDFLAQLCVDWEAAAQQAEVLGVRVVSTRLGIVLGKGGGPLEQMALPFKFFVGGPIGSGNQMVSWIHMSDAVGILLACLDDETISGPVNVTAPHAASNEELAIAIAKALDRPTWLRVPGFALELLFGEGAKPILGGQRAVPRAMLQHGYQFRFTTVGDAVRDVLTA